MTSDRHVSRRGRAVLFAAAPALAAVLATCSEARADVSSWLFVGTGPSLLHQDGNHERWTMHVETGLGTPATTPWVIGALARTQTYFRSGTDLSFVIRTASRGFVTGGFGLAVDVGPYARLWGTGSGGGTGSLVLGAPWGLTLNLGGAVGTHDAQTYAAVLGIDFARLTVYRTSGQNWWVNPFPAGRRD